MSVQYHDYKATFPVTVMPGDDPTLLRRQWWSHLGIGMTGVYQLKTSALPAPIQNFEDVFDPAMGKYTGPPAHIIMSPDAVPKFVKARPVPYA